MQTKMPNQDARMHSEIRYSLRRSSDRVSIAPLVKPPSSRKPPPAPRQVVVQRMLLLSQRRGFRSDAELCRFLGIHPATFSAWRQRGAGPSPDVLAEIARKFEVSADWLLGIEDDPRADLPPAIAEEVEKHLLAATSLIVDHLNSVGRGRRAKGGPTPCTAPPDS